MLRAESTAQVSARQLRVVVLVALLLALTGGLLTVWNTASSVPPARLIQIYRTHGCRCVFSWVKTLEAEGFTVRVYEYETLEFVRTSQRVPVALRGCHIGQYLDYFVEGHVASSSLRWLAQRHPNGRGISAVDPDSAQVLHPDGMPAQNYTLLFYNNQGVAQVVSDD